MMPTRLPKFNATLNGWHSAKDGPPFKVGLEISDSDTFCFTWAKARTQEQ